MARAFAKGELRQCQLRKDLAPHGPESPVLVGSQDPQFGADKLRKIHPEERCINCGGEMVIIDSHTYRLLCTRYPECRGVRDPSEETVRRIKAVADPLLMTWWGRIL